MCLVSSQRLAVVLCIALNAINLNSAATNTWTAITPDSAKGISVNADKQQQRQERLKTFQDGESFQVSDDIAVSATEQPILPSKADEKTMIIGGVYHNYRSSYVGNKSGTRISNRNRLGALVDVDNKIDQAAENGNLNEKLTERQPISEFENEIRYNVGPGVNISVDKDQELVSVFLDEDCLKDVFTGRGRKNELITKILPLFILPFLIQSAVVPFLLSTLKLLLIKSIVVGKIAIFLLLLSAFRNHVKYGYELGPSYYSEPPSRRSEALNGGYRVEGKPTTWVN